MLTPKSLLTAALVAVSWQGMACAAITTGGRAAGWRYAALETGLIGDGHLRARTPAAGQSPAEMTGWAPTGTNTLKKLHQTWICLTQFTLFCVGLRSCIIYLHWCFLHRSMQRSGLRQGWLLHASLEQPEVTPRRSSSVTRSRLWPSRGRMWPLKRTSRRQPVRKNGNMWLKRQTGSLLEVSDQRFDDFTRPEQAVEQGVNSVSRKIMKVYQNNSMFESQTVIRM